MSKRGKLWAISSWLKGRSTRCHSNKIEQARRATLEFLEPRYVLTAPTAYADSFLVQFADPPTLISLPVIDGVAGQPHDDQGAGHSYDDLRITKINGGDVPAGAGVVLSIPQGTLSIEENH